MPSGQKKKSGNRTAYQTGDGTRNHGKLWPEPTGIRRGPDDRWDIDRSREREDAAQWKDESEQVDKAAGGVNDDDEIRETWSNRTSPHGTRTWQENVTVKGAQR